MWTVFRHSFSQLRGQVIGWGLALGALAMILVPVYDLVVAQQAQFMELMKAYPPELTAFFGGDFTQMATPSGYLTIEFFSYMPLIIGVFGVINASGMLAGDEENGTLDLVLAHPVSRSHLFFGRVAAFLAAAISILAITWITLVAASQSSQLHLSAGELLMPFLPLLAEVLVFGAIGLFLSMLLPSRRLAATGAGIFMVLSFFVTGLATLSENLETAARFSPLNYYQSGDAIHGLNQIWFWGLLLVAATLTALAWLLFEKRDIRVGGEGGWGIPLPGTRARKALKG